MTRESIGEYLSSFGTRMPQALISEQQRIASMLAENQIENSATAAMKIGNGTVFAAP